MGLAGFSPCWLSASRGMPLTLLFETDWNKGIQYSRQHNCSVVSPTLLVDLHARPPWLPE